MARDPSRPPAQHRRGAKYQKLKQRAEAEGSLKKYEPFIVQSSNFP
jgi:hypothetical protein